METKILIQIMLFGVVYTRICLAASFNSTTDESSLLALKARITSDPHGILAKNWSQGTSFCTWFGVTCSHRHQRVTGLDLFRMGLQGTIAEEIGNLSFLTYLDMSNNSFNGLIPDKIGNLGRLRLLNLGYNQLNGHIPLSFGLLTNLERLNLSGNHLVGTIPRSIFNLSSLLGIDFTQNQLSGTLPLDICQGAPKLVSLRLQQNQLAGDILGSLSTCSSLRILYLSTNNFTGSIPIEIGNLTQLQVLLVRGNDLTGYVPSEIGRLTSLTWLNLEANKFIGQVPHSIFNLSGLQTLSLAFNELSGQLPSSIDKGLPNLEQFLLGTNQFYGRIPDSISNLSLLSRLSLTNNSFSGHIPITLGNLGQLQILGLGENQFTNNLSIPEQEFLTPLTNCEYLTFLDIGTNPIAGVLPKSLGSSSNLSASLQTFLAFSCNITGTIPDEYGNLSSLSWLNLGINELTGVIPGTLGQNLQSLQLDSNNLQGSISGSFCNLENLYQAGLWGNQLSGPLPGCLGSLPSLREIDLGNNAFNSSIPSTFWLNKVIQKIKFDNNIFDGSLPQEISNMKSLIELDLSGNLLSGGIPSTIGELQNLNVLVLSTNKLNGSMPDSFANLKDLRQLDLSHNNLSGVIPKSLETLSYLNYFNVSFNQLSGEIPDGGPFLNFTADSFVGNKGLCGASRFKVQACKFSIPKQSRKNRPLRYILPPIALIVVAAIVVILFLTYPRRKSLFSSVSDLPLGLMPRWISYHDILRATSNLDEGNLIGRGSLGMVYKGTFSDLVVAIKVFNLDVQGALKSFDTECQIMRRIRHRNLVKVITSSSNLDFKALVMAYMPNGNLDGLLYAPDMSLNISQRLGIMIDVASAIEYLHQGYSSPIIHCDLKPSNILLDEDMVAHVSDFGIAKLLPEEQQMAQTKTLGTIGYMAPEYGSSGLVSTKVDVYSYGILLMETFGRKKPTDGMFSGELTMKSWVSELFPNAIMQIVDADLLNENEEISTVEHHKCLTSIMGLALECTPDLPEERLNMKDVLVKIQKIKTEFHVAITRGR
ncbi:hypothetical protein Pfo_013832 [Paulownia fortunei]|nr:hypothetical protein Pfo_013832 [Paulownia fortunei]